MKKIALIIKHPFRDWDWRIDIVTVREEVPIADVISLAKSRMIGPFEIVAATEKIDFESKLTD